MRKLSAPGLPNSIQSYEGDSSLVPIISAGVIRVGSLKTRERKARSMRNEGEENQHNLQAFTAAQNKNYQLQSLRRTTVSSAQSHRRDAVPWYDASAETPRHQTLTNHYLTNRRPPQDKAQSRTAIIAAEFWTIKQQHHGCVMWCGMWTFDSASRTRFRRQAWKVTSFVTDDQDTNLNCTRWIFCLREANFWQKNIKTILYYKATVSSKQISLLIYKQMPDHEGVWEYSYYSVLFSILWFQHEF